MSFVFEQAAIRHSNRHRQKISSHKQKAFKVKYENKGFEEKLINALKHPERETVQRAVYILGKRKSAHAVKPLLDLYKQTNNTFLKIGILNALHETGIPTARECVLKVIESDMGLMSRIAKEIINNGSLTRHAE